MTGRPAPTPPRDAGVTWAHGPAPLPSRPGGGVWRLPRKRLLQLTAACKVAAAVAAAAASRPEQNGAATGNRSWRRRRRRGRGNWCGGRRRRQVGARSWAGIRQRRRVFGDYGGFRPFRPLLLWNWATREGSSRHVGRRGRIEPGRLTPVFQAQGHWGRAESEHAPQCWKERTRRRGSARQGWHRRGWIKEEPRRLASLPGWLWSDQRLPFPRA